MEINLYDEIKRLDAEIAKQKSIFKAEVFHYWWMLVLFLFLLVLLSVSISMAAFFSAKALRETLSQYGFNSHFLQYVDASSLLLTCWVAGSVGLAIGAFNFSEMCAKSRFNIKRLKEEMLKTNKELEKELAEAKKELENKEKRKENTRIILEFNEQQKNNDLWAVNSLRGFYQKKLYLSPYANLNSWTQKTIEHLSRTFSNFICSHCLKSVVVNELSVTCPFCNEDYSDKRFSVDQIIFDACPKCRSMIKYIKCNHCDQDINLFSSYNKADLERRRYGR